MPMSKSQLRERLSAIEPDESLYEGIGPSEVPLLRELLADEEAWLAARAAHALSRIDSESAQEALVAASKSDRPEVRVAVAASASALPPSVSDEVLAALIDDSNVGVRKFAIQSVSDNNSGMVRQKLTEVAMTEPHAPLRQSAELQARALAGPGAEGTSYGADAGAPPAGKDVAEPPSYGGAPEEAPPGMGADAPSSGGGSDSVPAGMGRQPPTDGSGPETAPPGMGAETPSFGGGTQMSSYGEGSESAPPGMGAEAPASSGGAAAAPPGMGWKSPPDGGGSEAAPPGMGAKKP